MKQKRNVVGSLARSTFKVLKDVCMAPVALMACVLPRRNDLWCFGACEGKRYGDHSAMLFEEIEARYPEIDVFWSTRSPGVRLELLKRNMPVVKTNTIRGFIKTLRAGVIIYTHGGTDHHIVAAAGAFRVQLWHGIPLKRFGADINVRYVTGKKLDQKLFAHLGAIRRRLLPWTHPVWDLMIFQSNLDEKRTGSAFRGKFRKGLVLGSIRAEWLAKKRTNLHTVEHRRKRLIQILYAPTHRKNGYVSLFERVPVPDPRQFQSQLESLGVEIKVRLHPIQDREVVPDGFLVPSVCVQENRTCDDIYGTLAESDAVVTDYSSIFVDALSIGIPVVCLAPDRQSYAREDQGLYSEIETFPGPIVDTWEQAVVACSQLVADGGDSGRQINFDPIDFYFGSDVKYDSGAMARVIEKIKELA